VADPSPRCYRPNMRSTDVGIEGMRILRAIAAGRVVRDESNGRRGMWATYVLEGEPCNMDVRRLGRMELIETPLVGPPTINAYGERVLAERGHDKDRPV
jgi:hypothetical protein